MSEYNIKQGIKNSDEQVYRELYSKYYVSLCYHAKKIVLDKDQAEEMVQLTFVRLWENRKKISIEKSVHSYLYRSVTNNCLNFIKSKISQIGKRSIQLENVHDYIAITQDSGHSIYIATELKSSIEDAINELPARCRQIFEISRFEGKTHDEIASRLGVTKNTVQKQISIALKKLKESLNDYIITLFMFSLRKK